MGSDSGGTISSTATNISFAKRFRSVAAPARPAATVIMIPTAVSMLRVVVEMAVVPREFRMRAIVPMMTMVIAAIFLCVSA